MGELAASTEFYVSMGIVAWLPVKLVKIPLYFVGATLGTAEGIYLALTLTVRSCPRSRRTAT